MIETKIFNKQEFPIKIANIYKDFFELSPDITDDINHLITDVKQECFFVIEYPYVDKIFRDSFYTYFSSKLHDYSRNCIRVSVFDSKINLSDFYDVAKQDELKTKYGGFFVLRSTYPNPIGRTVLSRDILINDDFINCKTSFPITCNGLKFSVSGFPYSSQDRETISCAETTLWGIMEYFGNRYVGYSPVLPSKIISSLKSIRAERQLPSRGLQVDDLSHALKKFGFGTRIYNREEFGDSSFESLLSCYIESGIPVITAISNDEMNFHHAVICMGREKIRKKHLDQLQNTTELRDFDDIKKKFIFMDDNLQPYQKAYLDTPTSSYNSALHQSKITHFITPLYPKIYLEAFEAKKYCITLLESNDFTSGIIRIFLTSSRSFKDAKLRNKKIPLDYKKHIAGLPMPKFIWVCELSDIKHLSDKKCYCTIILDATEPNINKFKPFLSMHLGDTILLKEKGSLTLQRLSEPLKWYEVYQNNLSGF